MLCPLEKQPLLVTTEFSLHTARTEQTFKQAELDG